MNKTELEVFPKVIDTGDYYYGYIVIDKIQGFCVTDDVLYIFMTGDTKLMPAIQIKAEPYLTEAKRIIKTTLEYHFNQIKN